MHKNAMVVAGPPKGNRYTPSNGRKPATRAGSMTRLRESRGGGPPLPKNSSPLRAGARFQPSGRLLFDAPGSTCRRNTLVCPLSSVVRREPQGLNQPPSPPVKGSVCRASGPWIWRSVLLLYTARHPHLKPGHGSLRSPCAWSRRRHPAGHAPHHSGQTQTPCGPPAPRWRQEGRGPCPNSRTLRR